MKNQENSLISKSVARNSKNMPSKITGSTHNAPPTYYGYPHKVFPEKLLAFLKAPNLCANTHERP